VDILADENLDRFLVDWLREQGHDVLWMTEFGPGRSDEEVLAAANPESRILLRSTSTSAASSSASEAKRLRVSADLAELEKMRVFFRWSQTSRKGAYAISSTKQRPRNSD